MKRKNLRLKIEKMDDESVFFVSDFLDISSDKEISKMFSELEEQGVIKRLAKGSNPSLSANTKAERNGFSIRSAFFNLLSFFSPLLNFAPFL